MKKVFVVSVFLSLLFSAAEAFAQHQVFPGKPVAPNAVVPGVRGMVVPRGTDAQRPDNPLTGTLRFNSESALLEFWDGSDWAVTGAGDVIGSHAANTFFASPDGSAGTPTFRVIVGADLPLIPLSKGGTGVDFSAIDINTLVGGTAAGGALEAKTLGSDDGSVAITHGVGTINLSALTATTTGAPGTLTATSNPIQIFTSTGTATLPVASTCPGKIFFLNRNVADVGAISVTAQGTDKIGSSPTAASVYRLQGDICSITVQSNGSDRWYVLAQSPTHQSHILVTATPFDLGTDTVTEGNIYVSQYDAGATLDITLPPSVTNNRGREITFTKGNFAAGTGDVVITAPGSDRIMFLGSPTATVTLTEKGESITLSSGATTGHAGWYVVSHYKPNLSVKTISSSPVTLLSTDPEDVWIDVNGGARTVIMPATTSIKHFRFNCYNSTENSSTNQATLTGAGSDRFSYGGGTSATLVMSQGDTVEVKSDGVSRWFIVAGKMRGANVAQTGGSNQLFATPLMHRSTAHTATSVSLTNSAAALSTSECVQYFDTSSNTITCNLPAIVTTGTVAAGKIFILVKTSASNSLVIDPNSTQTVNGASTFTLTELGEAIAIQNANGISSTDWKILWHYKPSLESTGSPTFAGLTSTANITITGAGNGLLLPDDGGDHTGKLVMTGNPAANRTFSIPWTTDATFAATNQVQTWSGNQTYNNSIIVQDGSTSGLVIKDTGGGNNYRFNALGTEASQRLLQIPGSLGGNVTFAFANFNNNFSVSQNMAGISSSANIAVTGAGNGFLLPDAGADHTIKLVSNTDEGANRDLIVPALGGNRTIAVLENTNVFTAAQTVATSLTVTGASSSLILTDAGNDHTVTLKTNADNSGNVDLLVPNCGSTNRTLLLTSANSTQAVTSAVEFNKTMLRLRDSGGDHAYLFDSLGNEAANRTLNVPLLGQDATFAFTDFANVWTVAPSFPTSVTVTGASSSLILKDSGDDHNVTFSCNSNNSADRALIIPALTADRTIIINGGTLQTMSGQLRFNNGNLVLRDSANNNDIDIIPAGDESSNRVLSIPLLGADDTLMTLGTDQVVSGIKTHAADIVTTGATTDIIIGTAGGGLQIKEGTDATMGVATLSSGTVTVNTTKVTANSRVFLTIQNGSANIGTVWVSARSAGTSFTISSTNILGDQDVAWMIVEPAPWIPALMFLAGRTRRRRRNTIIPFVTSKRMVA